MSGTVTGIWVLAVVIVVSLAVWLVLVRYAAKRPGQKFRRREQMRGVVQGGQHVGGGRSVAPRRDAPVPEGGGGPPSPDAADVEDVQNERAGSRGSAKREGSPMDL
jgi:hypothetical protein